VALPRDVKLRLIPATAEQARQAGEFALCAGPNVETKITNGGFFILAARPAAAFSRDRVASVDLSSDGVGTGCGSRFTEQGASFSLVPVEVGAGGPGAPLAQAVTALTTAIEADVTLVLREDPDTTLPLRLAQALSKLRNAMAYWCAGYDAPGQRIRSLAVPAPDAPAQPLSPIEVMRAAGTLASCDVPLALLYVTERGLEWADAWSVRRAPVARVGPDPLGLAGEERPRADAAAMIMQFRDHASMFLQATPPQAPDQVSCFDWFLVLPPVGMLPIKTSTEAGFVAETFFPWISGWGEYAFSDVPKAWAEMLLRRSAEEVPLPLEEWMRPALYRFTADTAETEDWLHRYVMFCSHTPWVFGGYEWYAYNRNA
jgi:hypothetical protein